LDTISLAKRHNATSLRCLSVCLSLYLCGYYNFLGWMPLNVG